MAIGIYSILNKIDLKRYIGKSIDTDARFWVHQNLLVKPICDKNCNRHLYNAVQKYGIKNFEFSVLEIFKEINENILKEAELKWMDFYDTCNRKFGYNLRRDSSTNCIVHKETVEILSSIFEGNCNPNYGNKWSDKQKQSMREKQLARHKAGNIYSDEWKNKIGVSSKTTWQNEKLKSQMAINVSKAKSTHDFYKFNLKGELLKIYSSLEEIIKENSEYKWQNIYAACNGNKPTYKGFLWARILKNSI